MRIKRTLQPFVDHGEIIFGFGNQKLIRKIPATEDNLRLVKALDEQGTDYLTELQSEKLSDWQSKGLLTTNCYDEDKFSRNINFFEWMDTSSNVDPGIYQNKLANSTVLIVGLGGIGSNIAEILARMGVGKLILCDFDIIEESNLTRQSTFQKKDVGRQKLDVVSDYINMISDSDVQRIHKKIDSLADLNVIYSNNQFDLAICCADKPRIEIDLWFDNMSAKYKIPFISGSYASTVINYAYINPGKTISLQEFYGENAITDSNLLSHESPTSIIAPVSFMAAGLISYKVAMSLTDLFDLPNILQIDLTNWEVIDYDI